MAPFMGAFLHFGQRCEKHIRGVCQIYQDGYDVIVHLSAGNIISLKLFGLVATVVLTGGGSAGASLTIKRLN
ncbi:hypothetical protein ACDX66_19230 [Peribacillus frigoritolerans]